ncbi:unnamed protein product [Didymodactylos carnosus]|uniref:Uncharacterized protein n=1 Tax=Didymodactylos carnosus TaxID=1234261 RepID=A0A814PMD1_9BILA|nr:unnamed protein product [Didymodactylos carnosus]CAF3872561.1 unnamed protein product [Didymodactylos carnosus]
MLQTVTTNGITIIYTDMAAINYANEYRDMSINRCGFSSSMDIGYGSCTPRPYDLASSIILCICSTDYCSESLSTCQTSVIQARSSPPTPLPIVYPTLTSTVSWYDNTYTAANTSRFSCGSHDNLTLLFSQNFPVNITACNIYVQTHTILCNYWDIGGYIDQGALFDDMAIVVQRNYARSLVSGVFWAVNSIYEGTTNIWGFTAIPFSSGLRLCLCGTNNCNRNGTCQAGTSEWPNSSITSVSAASSTVGSSVLSTVPSSTPLSSSGTYTYTTRSSQTAVLVTSTTVRTTSQASINVFIKTKQQETERGEARNTQFDRELAIAAFAFQRYIDPLRNKKILLLLKAKARQRSNSIRTKLTGKALENFRANANYRQRKCRLNKRKRLIKK